MTSIQDDAPTTPVPVNEHGWSRPQVFAVGLAALAIILDGLDNRLLPLVIPGLMKVWGETREAFAIATSIGLAGMVAGTAGGGMLSDRLGRRPVMIASLALFGFATLANGLANDMITLMVARLFAGIGLGGLMPASAAFLTEFSPHRSRTFVVTAGMVCIAIGGALSGFLGALVLPEFGWRALFFIGGGLAIVVAVMQLLWLPETPAFVTLRLAREQSHGVSSSSFKSVPVGRLFERRYVRDTIGLWAAFFTIFTCLYMESQWMPTILSERGYSVEVASVAASCLAFGGIFAAVFGVLAINRLGSRMALGGIAFLGAVLMLAMTRYPMDPGSAVWPLYGLLAVTGFLIGGLQILIYPVATQIYDAALRGTGIGWAVGVGRLGAVLSPFATTTALAVGGWRAFFVALAIGLLVTLAGLLAIKGHIPARAAGAN